MELLAVLGSIALALFLIVHFDWGSSKVAIYYGQSEKTKLLQDRYGYPSAWKVAVMIAVKMSPFLLYFVPQFGWGVALWGPIVGLPHLLIGLNNRQKARGKREQQTQLREWAKNYRGSDEAFTLAISLRLDLHTRHDRHWFELFGWLYYMSPSKEIAATAEEKEVAKAKCAKLIRDWAVNDGKFPA